MFTYIQVIVVIFFRKIIKKTSKKSQNNNNNDKKILVEMSLKSDLINTLKIEYRQIDR